MRGNQGFLSNSLSSRRAELKARGLSFGKISDKGIV